MVSRETSENQENKILRLPLSHADVMGLKVGDAVLLSGKVVTGRDKVHKFLCNERPDKKNVPFDLEGSAIYHCGPIIKKVDGSYVIIAAGPTTSMRVEMYEADVIKTYGIRGIIGKGGMGENTLNALRDNGCVYLHTISGAAAYLADRIKAITGGWKIEEFGETEAMWQLEIENFPVIVTMDAYGNSLHRDVEKVSLEGLKRVLGPY